MNAEHDQIACLLLRELDVRQWSSDGVVLVDLLPTVGSAVANSMWLKLLTGLLALVASNLLFYWLLLLP